MDVWESDSKKKKKKLSENVLYLDWGGSYTNIHISELLKRYTKYAPFIADKLHLNKVKFLKSIN